MATHAKESTGVRTIQAHFMFAVKGRKSKTLKRNSGKHVRTVGMRAYDHMQANSYGANVVEIWNIDTGELYQVITRRFYRVETVFKLFEGEGTRGWHVQEPKLPRPKLRLVKKAA